MGANVGSKPPHDLRIVVHCMRFGLVKIHGKFHTHQQALVTWYGAVRVAMIVNIMQWTLYSYDEGKVGVQA